MGVSSFIVKILAKRAFKKVQSDRKSAINNQRRVFCSIRGLGKNTLIAKNLNLNREFKYGEFVKKVPISNYEDYQNYISLISKGEKNILTQGSPDYFAITSGTTSGTKYIPLTKRMWDFHAQSIKELLLLYAHQTNNYNFSGAGMMFIQGSPKLSYFNKIPFGKLSGIAARHVPFFLKKNRFPSMKTNEIEPWAKKIDSIVGETWNKNMQIIGGIPPWVITYFDALLEHTKKGQVKEVFPSLKLYIHGGTGFGPYKDTFLKLCGEINTLEVYPASEGFFAYQDNLLDEGLLLLTNHGVFYEFILLKDFQNKKLNRITLESVDLNVDYVMIVSTIAGLWAYNTGDTIRFVSKDPYKIIFSGRATQYCSAFGEHVIEKEVQAALIGALNQCGGAVTEFTVCPKVCAPPEVSYHEWFIEFSEPPDDLLGFKKILSQIMRDQNVYYKDLVDSGVISSLKIFVVKRGGFNAYMKSIGKFGGQNKCPHLSNERTIGNFLLKKHVEN